jgi:hypothetical protein
MLFVKDWQYTRASQHKEQAAALLQAQQYQEALQSIQAALRSSPTLPEYHAVTGSILLYLRHRIRRLTTTAPPLKPSRSPPGFTPVWPKPICNSPTSAWHTSRAAGQPNYSP